MSLSSWSAGELHPGLRVSIDVEDPTVVHLETGKPHWALDPVTGKKVGVSALFLSPQPVPCPSCGVENPVGAKIIVFEADGHPGFEWLGLQCEAGCRKHALILVPKKTAPTYGETR